MQVESVIYTAGWQEDGSWTCPICKTMIRKNLLNERPFDLAHEHVVEHTYSDIMRVALNIRHPVMDAKTKEIL